MLCVVIALAAGVVLLAPRLRARARARDRAEGRHRRRLGARAGAQGRRATASLHGALRRGADLRRGVRGEPRVRLHRRHRRARPRSSTRAARTPPGARVLPRPGMRRRDCAPRRRATAWRVGKQYMVSMPIARRQAAGHAAHRHRRPASSTTIMLEVMLDVLVVLVVSLFFTLELLQLHGRRPARDGPRGVRAAGRARCARATSPPRARMRAERRDRRAARGARRRHRPRQRAPTRPRARARGRPARPSARAREPRCARARPAWRRCAQRFRFGADAGHADAPTRRS